MRIPLFLLSLVTSSVAQINYTPPTHSFYDDVDYDQLDEITPQQFWNRLIVNKAYGEARYEALKKHAPWFILHGAIDEKDAKFSKKILIEARAVTCSIPESHITFNWKKFTKENGIKGDAKLASATDPKQHIAWGLIDQSLDRKDFAYAEKLSQFLKENYSFEAWEKTQRKDSPPPSTYFEADIEYVIESGDFHEVQRLWTRSVWAATEKCNPAGWYAGELPWIILRLSIEHKEAAYAQMMLVETYDKANLPPNHYPHSKQSWDRLSNEGKRVIRVATSSLLHRSFSGKRFGAITHFRGGYS